ncbi:hypothetical protein GGS24DRAFT_138450 [Hypoxylon argillaceum]|nr:hypothetical protein GGS24DRAFT_138450 [Hypoxylon argillaceum]
MLAVWFDYIFCCSLLFLVALKTFEALTSIIIIIPFPISHLISSPTLSSRLILTRYCSLSVIVYTHCNAAQGLRISPTTLAEFPPGSLSWLGLAWLCFAALGLVSPEKRK